MTKMVRLPVGGSQEQQKEGLSDCDGSKGRNVCTEISDLRESVLDHASTLAEPSNKSNALEDAHQDLHVHRRTSSRLLTSNRNDGIATSSTSSSSSSSPALINVTEPIGTVESTETENDLTLEHSSTSIICSLPLNRLESILGMLNIIKKTPNHIATTVPLDTVSSIELKASSARSKPDQSRCETSYVPAGVDVGKDDPSDSNLAHKVLCLYCDRSFGNQKLMLKHTDRIHRIAKERRSSARVVSNATSGSDASSCCNFCHKGKALNLSSGDLPELFKHLITVHADRYYACESCNVRFSNEEAREAHLESLHPPVTNSGRPKSKAALKAFSPGQTNVHQQQTARSSGNNKTPKKSTSVETVAEPLSVQPELVVDATDRLAPDSGSSSNSKGEPLVVVPNICLRSSLRNSTTLLAESVVNNGKSKRKAFKKSERLLRRNSEPMLLSRLGIAQHRLPRQSRRLLAAASSVANATIGLETSSPSSTASSGSSATPSLAGKSTVKKKVLALSNEDAQPLHNCYNKITKLKTIRSTLNNAPVLTNDGAHPETADSSSKTTTKGSDYTANVGGINTSASFGPINDMLGGSLNRTEKAGGNSTGVSNHVGCNTVCGISSNTCNSNSIVQLSSSTGIFDEDFYENVTRNVKNNLSCHLDGKLEASAPNAPSPMSPVAAMPTVRSTLVKSPVSIESKIHEATNLPAISVMFPTLLTVDQYGTEPTPTTSTTNLTSLPSTYSVKTKKPITKNSWKWKWDFVKKYKYVNENGRIVKKIKQPTIGLRDLSKLDMWTQLTMRTKHELFQHSRTVPERECKLPLPSDSVAGSSFSTMLPVRLEQVGATLRHEKRTMVEQLDQILDARLLPQIDLEQNDQRIIKIEPSEKSSEQTEKTTSDVATSTKCSEDKELMLDIGSVSLVPWASNQSSTQMTTHGLNFLQHLQLMQLNRNAQQSPVVLSGEWARPRCYICYGCGAKFTSLKQVEEHRIFRHPHVHSTFYEIVGRELIEKRLYKHFFIPFMALDMHREYCVRLTEAERIAHSITLESMNCRKARDSGVNTLSEIKNEDSSSNEATSFSTTTSGSSSGRYSTNSSVTTLMDTSTDASNALAHCSALTIDDEDESSSALPVMCSKCHKECQNQIVLYAHILHCSNDYVWLQAKKRMKYRRAKRRRGGNRSGINCAAPTSVSALKKVQHQPNVEEKADSIANVATSTHDESSLNAIDGNSININNSSGSSSSLSSSSSSTSSSSSDTQVRLSGTQKNRKSPKPKESDSDIVKRLLANLPAKRNSRQMQLQTSNQINKRPIVPGRKAFHSSALLSAAKGRVADGSNKSAVEGKRTSPSQLCESMNLQPTPLTAASVQNGNGSSTETNKNSTTSSLPTSRKVIGPQCNTTAIRARQTIPCSLSITGTTLRASSRTVHKVPRKKSRVKQLLLGNSFRNANGRKGHTDFAHAVQHLGRTKKVIVKRCAAVATVSNTRMLRWNKTKHELVRISTSNGHHRLLRSSGQRVLPTSLQSIRNKARKRNALKRRNNMLNRGIQTPSAGELTNKLSNVADSSMEDSTVDSVCKDVAKDASQPSSGLITCDKTSVPTQDQEADTSTSVEGQNHEDNSTKDVHESKQQLPFVDVLAPNTASVPVITSIQFTPDQPIKKQRGGDHDPPATPTKLDPSEMMQSSLSQSISPISSATLPSHFISGTSSGCKRKPKKLNDCIAMLTGKLSERLGVDFFNNETHPEPTHSPQHESLHSSCLSATESATVHTTGGTSAMQSEQSLMDVKSTPHNQAQAAMSSSSLPIVSDNSFESPTSLRLAQPKTQLAVSTWSHDSGPTGMQSYPQTTPIQLKTAINVRPLSPNVAPQSTFQYSTLSIESADPVSDEPLNLSKNSPLGSTRNTKMMPKRDDHRPHVSTSYTVQQESSMIGHLPAQPALHFMHTNANNRPSHFHQHLASNSAIVNQHNAHKLTSPIAIMPDSNNATITPKSGSGNLSSIKLPPGLIIERVEYKQSRPTFSKEAPSVTIVARHRQVPAHAVLPSNVESSVTESSIDSTASLANIPFAVNSSHFVKPVLNSATNLKQHSEPNHTKIVGYSNYSDHSNHPNCSEQVSESTSSMRLPSGLRSGPCAENRISVTITESKTPNLERKQEVHMPKTSAALCLLSQSDKMNASQCSTSQKTPQLNTMHSIAPPKQSISMVTSGPMHKVASIGVMGHMAGLPEKNTPAMTTLIIPQVPMPPMPSQIIPPTTKRTRRKSVFVPLPVSAVETNRDIPVKPVRQQHPTCPSIPAAQSTLSTSTGLASANLLASMSLSFVAPNLLPVSGAPMLGPIDLQRLASVTLPAHLKPPVIPPLTIPSAAAASAALLEKIFHPTRSEALSTSLELKRDSQYNPDKQPIKEPLTIRTNVLRTPGEENCGVAMPPTISDMSTFTAPIEHASKTTSLSASRTESIKTFDSTVGKVNAPTCTNKGVGRIIKRRASVADYQRKALMEQIWNKSILDKIMEKHTIKVTGVDEGQKDSKIQIPPKHMVVESFNDSKHGDACLRNMHSVEASLSVQREPQIAPPNITDVSFVHNHDRENSEKMKPSTHQNVDQVDQHIELETPHRTGNGKMLEANESVSIEQPQNTAEDRGKHLHNEPMCPSIQSSTVRVEKVIDADRTHAKERLNVNQYEVPDPSKPFDATQPNHATTITDEAHTVQKDGSSEMIDSLAATDSQKGGLTKTVRKRRKNELASILSDQLLESFKEVDKSRLNDLKLLHDLTCETPDAKFTLEQIPQLAKRKSNPRMPKLAVQDSPKIATLIAPKKVYNTKKITKEKESTTEHNLDEDTSKTSVAVSNEVPTNAKNTACRLNVSDKAEKDPSIIGFRRMRKLSIDIERFSSLQKDVSKDCADVQDVSTDQLATMHKVTRSKAQVTVESNITVEPKKTVMRIMDAQCNNDITAESNMQTVEEIQVIDRNRSSGKQASSHPSDPQELQHTPIDTHRCTEFSDNNKIPNSQCLADVQWKEETSNLTAAREKPVASNPPKRIMSRRKSVFVDRDLAQYVAKEEEEHTKNQLFNTTFKDDLILTSRRGTRSQGKLGLDLVESFVEAAMKPRDPRRRVLQKRREEERVAKENKEQMPVAPDAEEKITGLVNQIGTIECTSLEQKELMIKHKGPCELPNMNAKTSEEERTTPLVGLQNNIPLRRINTRRSSVCVRGQTTSQRAVTSSTTNIKDKELIAEPSKEDENLHNIGNEVKRIYRRRASIYQVPDELQEQLENGCEKSRKLHQTSHVQEIDSGGDEGSLPVTKKQITSQKNLTRRSKTPGPSDWKRRNQLPLNGTPEPLIESLLLHTSSLEESNAPKRRTTKNSQIAETVSKLFNIQEEIMLIDSSRRKPRKLNPPNTTTLLEPPMMGIDKEPVETVNENNMKNGIENSDPLLSNVFPLVDSKGVEKTIATPSLLARKSFSFSNDEDESPKAINKLVETIINNTGNSSNASTDYSDDDNMSLACFAARSNALDSGAANQHADVFAKPPLGTDVVFSTGRAMSVIADDDSTTNTDALDDDMMSVTTEIPTSLGRSTLNSGRIRRKRRKSRRQCSKLKRQQAKAQEQNSKPMQTFNCELCRKVFKKQDAYNKHRMTLSHIAKLSEQEYLIAQQKMSLNNDDIANAISEQSQMKTKLTFEESSVVPTLEEVKKKYNTAEGSTILESSPSNRTSSLTILGAEKNNHRDEQTVKELSQEEKLFYECCSMLKESNSNENDQLNHLAVSLKTTDTMDQGNSSDRRLVFTDDGNSLSTSISSAFIPSVDVNQILHVGAACATREESVTEQVHTNYQTRHEVMGEGDNDTFQRCVSPQSSVQSSSTNSSGSASSQSCNNAKIKTKGALKGYDNFKVSIPMTGLTVMSAASTASIGIGIGKESRLDTLADVALCGDIPKEFGIAEQSDEVNSTDIERMPEDQLISLCGEAKLPSIEVDLSIDNKVDIPISTSIVTTDERSGVTGTKNSLVTSRTGEVKTSKSMAKSRAHRMKYSENVAKSQKKPSSRWITGTNRRRTSKHSLQQATESERRDSSLLDESDDVYAFQDSPCDGDLPSVYSSKKNNTFQHQHVVKSDESAHEPLKHKSTVAQTSALEDHEDSQMSSLSFSDRDDFVYGTNTMSEEEEEEEEEDKTSSISSEQTSPKKLTSADVQKKSLIMGRIFKKGGAKEKVMSDTKIRSKVSATAATAAMAAVVDSANVPSAATITSKSTAAVQPIAKDFDKLFDTLKNAAEPSVDAMQSSNDAAVLSITLTESDRRHTDETHGPYDSGIGSKLHECKDKNPRGEHQLWQNENEVLTAGAARLRRRRTIHQKNLTESWDSDEFEDFQAGDIMKLIDRTEDDEINDQIHSNANTAPAVRLQCEKSGSAKKTEVSECTEPGTTVRQSPSLSDGISLEKDKCRTDQLSDKQSALKKETALLDKKSSKSDVVVTDDTIRKVMESVILETMGKASNSSGKRKPAVHGSCGGGSASAFNSKALRLMSRNNNNVKSGSTAAASAEDVSQALELTSLEEHTLESSVVISSKTITSKFKQKLNSSTRYSADDRRSVEIEIAEKEKEPNSSKLNLLPEISSTTKPPVSASSNINSAILNNNNNNTNNNNNSDNRHKPMAKSPRAAGIGGKGRVKPKSIVDDWTGKQLVPLATNKQRRVAPKKMKNVAYDPDSDYEQSIKCKKVKRKLLENDIEANLKIEQLQSTLMNSDDSNILLTTSRRKRNAGEMLYYWSSTSDEEIEREVAGPAKGSANISKASVNNGAPSGKKRGRKKKQVDNTESSVERATGKATDGVGVDKKDLTSGKRSSQEISALSIDKKSKPTPAMIGKKSGAIRKKQQRIQIDSDKSSPNQEPIAAGDDAGTTSNEHLQQHGWIMGDSHKKLVTLLAHAKGKHDSRKTTNNRRK